MKRATNSQPLHYPLRNVKSEFNQRLEKKLNLLTTITVELVLALLFSGNQCQHLIQLIEDFSIPSNNQIEGKLPKYTHLMLKLVSTISLFMVLINRVWAYAWLCDAILPVVVILIWKIMYGSPPRYRTHQMSLLLAKKQTCCVWGFQSNLRKASKVLHCLW